MRVTERRMMEVAATALSRQREKAAAAGEQLTTGVRVARPSQDLAGWTEGARARARQTMSEARGDAIGLSQDRLDETDRALEGIGGIVSRARELAVQLENGTYGADERASAVAEVSELRAAALALARGMGPDGEYLLAGGAGTTEPFDASGAYVGDSTRREVEVGEGTRLIANLPGSVLTASAGVDVLATLDGLASALGTNDVAGIGAALDGLGTAIGQVAGARSEVGARMSALDLADEARGDLELSLAEIHQRAVESDPVAAASQLAQTQQAFEASRTVAEQIIAMFRRG
jgi:flagellar hook-associated protein 3 FlgL